MRGFFKQIDKTEPPRTFWSSRRGSVNRKRVQRLWREEGLRVPVRRHKRRRVGTSTAGEWLRVSRVDEVWALDFQFDATTDGRVVKLLHVISEHPREALAIVVERRIDADRVVEDLDRIVTARGADPAFIRMDNGRSSPRTPSAASA